MPRGDRTGPAGAGPMTGRGAGFCAGYDTPGYANPVAGRGFGGGFGRGRGFAGGGRGWRNGFNATGLPGWVRWGGAAAVPQRPGPEIEKQALQDQVAALQSELEFIQKRLSELETGNTEG